MNVITNRRLVANTGSDFYPTPEWGTRALITNEKFEGDVWEPACGNGAMSNVLKQSGLNVYSSDLYDHGYGDTGLDFLTEQQVFDNVITNPPFNIAEDFVLHGLRSCNKKLALLLRLAFLESVGRYHNIYSVHPPSTVWVFSQRLSMYPEGSPVKGGGTTSYGWFVWDKQDTSQATQIKWIKPGLKTKGS